MKQIFKRASYNNVVFWVSSIVVLCIVLFGALAPERFAEYASILLDFTTINFGWFYLTSMAFFVGFCLFLAFSRFGRIKLGKEQDQPAYSFYSWISMLFACGFGSGLVFWGVAEPMSHFGTPPYSHVEPHSAEAARLAMHYSFFNWGFHQWSVFAVVGLALSYFQFRKKGDSLISSTLTPLIGKRSRRIFNIPIDILAVIATTIGVATSFGMAALQINGGLQYVFSFPNETWLQLLIIAVMYVAYQLSAITGIDKGMKILSNINLALTLGLMVYVLFAGPTVFILEGLTLAIGDYLQHFIQNSFYVTPYDGGTWVRDWTVFYWAWVISWSPFVGSFVARISKGRTIREFVFGVLIVPPFIGLIWISIFGGTALYMDLYGNASVAAAVSNDVTTALFVMFKGLPFELILSVLSLILIALFIITSADSATYILGVLTSKGSLNPSRVSKFIWGTLMASITAVLILSSGLKGLQTASLVSALPFTCILIMMCISLIKSLRGDERAAALENEYFQREKKAQ